MKTKETDIDFYLEKARFLKPLENEAFSTFAERIQNKMKSWFSTRVDVVFDGVSVAITEQSTIDDLCKVYDLTKKNRELEKDLHDLLVAEEKWREEFGTLSDKLRKEANDLRNQLFEKYKG